MNSIHCLLLTALALIGGGCASPAFAHGFPLPRYAYWHAHLCDWVGVGGNIALIREHMGEGVANTTLTGIRDEPDFCQAVRDSAAGILVDGADK